jgi:hypothetical protein
MTEPAFIFSTQCCVFDYVAEAEMAHFSAGQNAHANLLVNSRVIQALRRLAPARGAPMETRYKNCRIEVHQTDGHAFADWTGKSVARGICKPFFSNFCMP